MGSMLPGARADRWVLAEQATLVWNEAQDAAMPGTRFPVVAVFDETGTRLLPRYESKAPPPSLYETGPGPQNSTPDPVGQAARRDSNGIRSLVSLCVR